jgi:hypothetical protein
VLALVLGLVLLWVVLAVLGGLGGGFYYYKVHGFAAGIGDGADSLAAITDTTPLRDTTAARTPAIHDSDSRPPRRSPESSATPAPLPTPPRPAAPAQSSDSARAGQAPRRETAPGDSGGIRIIGLPRGSTVMIDEKPVTEPVTRLPAGPHAVGVSAPRFNFYADTVVVRAGDTLELSPPLTAIGAPVPARRPSDARRSPRRRGPRCFG